MEREWDINRIREILPQKYPFLFIDRVIDVDETKGRITCLKNLTINDYFFEGHFTDNPILPWRENETLPRKLAFDVMQPIGKEPNIIIGLQFTSRLRHQLNSLSRLD